MPSGCVLPKRIVTQQYSKTVKEKALGTRWRRGVTLISEFLSQSPAEDPRLATSETGEGNVEYKVKKL